MDKRAKQPKYSEQERAAGYRHSPSSVCGKAAAIRTTVWLRRGKGVEPRDKCAWVIHGLLTAGWGVGEGQPLQSMTLGNNACVQMEMTAPSTRSRPTDWSEDLSRSHGLRNSCVTVVWAGLVELLLLFNVKPEAQETSERPRSGIASN